MRRTILALALAAVALLAVPAAGLGQSGDNVLLVVNESSADSARIAERYARARAVPQDQLLRVKVDGAADEVDLPTYVSQIETPVADWLKSHSAQDRILFIVLTKGIPLRIKGTTGRGGTTASVDSELTLLYRRLTGAPAPLAGPMPNPYFLGGAPFAQAKPFSHQTHDIYLVTRLDGYTTDDVLKLIDRGASPVRDGRVLLDQKSGVAETPGDTWLKSAAEWMTSHGFGDRVVLDTTTRVLANEKGVLGYYSWGSNDPAVTQRTFGLGFVPGAIAGQFVSTDGRTFKEPPAEWAIGPSSDSKKFWAGSPQSLAGDLVREGVTGVAAHVAEPFLDATIRPHILFPAYLSGFNLAESFYLSMPSLSWQTLVIGDPLCAPFPRTALQPSDIDRGIDAATELPALFSTRRLEAVVRQGTRPDAARLVLRAEARTAKGDKAGALKALEEATVIDPNLVAAQMLLAQTHEEAKDYDRAIDRYRHAVAADPSNAAALNNLAYALAVRKGRADEALGYAERAVLLSRGSPTVVDTHAWVLHLAGRDREAAPLLFRVAKTLPDNAEVRLHAAVVFAAVGVVDQAATELDAALRLDPSLAGSDEVKALKAKLGRK